MKNNELIQEILVKVLAHSTKDSEMDMWHTTESLFITYDDTIRKQMGTIVAYLENEK